MPETKRYRCDCGYEFDVRYDRSASNPGRRFKELNGKPLGSMKICKCGKRLALDDNPLFVEK
jgi:hypothetical protein